MGSEEPEFPLPSGRGRRCDRHSLATGPDGWCALCRSESLPPPRPYPIMMLSGLLAAILAVTLAVLAQRGWQQITAQPEPTAARSAQVAGTGLALTGPAPEATPTAPLEPAPPVPEQVLSLPTATTAPAVITPVPAAPLPLPTVGTPDRRPSEADIQMAFRATPILMYATTWCGVCRQARAFMAEAGLAYREIDPDTTPGGWDKVQQLAGRKAVPVIVVDGQVSTGLSRERILSNVARSMERRLGMTGIKFRNNRPDAD